MYTDPADTKFALAVGGLARARPGLASGPADLVIQYLHYPCHGKRSHDRGT